VTGKTGDGPPGTAVPAPDPDRAGAATVVELEGDLVVGDDLTTVRW
jgi:hypothetical protein